MSKKKIDAPITFYVDPSQDYAEARSLTVGVINGEGKIDHWFSIFGDAYDQFKKAYNAITKYRGIDKDDRETQHVLKQELLGTYYLCLS